MSIELEPTGERVIEDAYHRDFGAYVIYVMHAASYRFAEPFCEAKRVLDLGCGSGYGAARIAQDAEFVDGVDVSDEAVAFASAHYSAHNPRYSRIDPTLPLPFENSSFDTVLSFQVIEHVHDELAYPREARRVLKPGGHLLVITPDRKYRLLPSQKPWNRWHLREYSSRSLSDLVAQVFEIDQCLKMGAPWDIARVEHVRYKRTKWLTLPMTLPFFLEPLRRRGLDLLHSILRRGKKVSAESSEPRPDYGFDETAVLIAREPPYPMNLLVVARKGTPPRA